MSVLLPNIYAAKYLSTSKLPIICTRIAIRRRVSSFLLLPAGQSLASISHLRQANHLLVAPTNTSMAPIELQSLLNRYFPTFTSSISLSDGFEVTRTIYPTETYVDSEKADIVQWLEKVANLPSWGAEGTRATDQLEQLNIHLSTRTTLLGTKPSVADVALYTRLAPQINLWPPEQKTGEKGYHHIVRYVDFVQNAPLFGLSIAHEDRISIDPGEVLFVPKPLDPREEKERKKKEKEAAAAAGTQSLPLGRTKEEATGKSKKEKVKSTIESAKEALKDVTAGDPSAGPTSKKEKLPKPQKQSAKETPLSPALIDLRVGHILKAVTHPNADSLYVSTVAVGDSPGADNTSEYEGQIVRTVCSGLNGLIPLEEMQNRKIVAVCNLKPVTMRGVKSCAMVLAASPRIAEGEKDNHAGPVELVSPPPDAKAGDRILFDGWDGEPESVLNPKKKVWEMCQVGFTTTNDLGVAFDVGKVEQLRGDSLSGKPELGRLKVKGGGACTVKSLKGGVVR